MQELHERWDQILSHLLFYDTFNNTKKEEITAAINDFYFEGKKGRSAIEMRQNFTNVRLLSVLIILNNI